MSQQYHNAAVRQPTIFAPIAEEEFTPGYASSSNSLPKPTPSAALINHHHQQQPPPMNLELQKALDEATASMSASTDPAIQAHSPSIDSPSSPSARAAGKQPVRITSDTSALTPAAIKIDEFTPATSSTPNAPPTTSAVASHPTGLDNVKQEMKYEPQPSNTLQAKEKPALKIKEEEKKRAVDDDDEQKSKSCMATVVGAIKTCVGYAACVPCRTEREGCCAEQGCFKLWLQCGPCLAFTCCPCLIYNRD